MQEPQTLDFLVIKINGEMMEILSADTVKYSNFAERKRSDCFLIK